MAIGVFGSLLQVLVVLAGIDQSGGTTWDNSLPRERAEGQGNIDDIVGLDTRAMDMSTNLTESARTRPTSVPAGVVEELSAKGLVNTALVQGCWYMEDLETEEDQVIHCDVGHPSGKMLVIKMSKKTQAGRRLDVCGAGCATCTLDPSCTLCTDADNMTPDQGANTCSCNSGFYLPTSTSSLCEACGTECNVCDSNRCQECNPGFYLSPDDVTECLACGSYCAQCDGTACNQCNYGYYQDTSTSTDCLPCGDGCVDCGSSTSCSLCEESLTQVSGGNTCACAAGEYKNTAGFCELCGSGCAICSSATVCSKCAGENMTPDATTNTCSCAIGTYDNEGTCTFCGVGCSECSSSRCSKCLNIVSMVNINSNSCQCTAVGYLISGNTCISSCNTGYYPSGQGCLACGSGCATCSATACSACVNTTAMTIDPKTNGCVCNTPGTYANGNTCTACGTGCAACNSATACSTCTDANMTANKGVNACSCNLGYYLSSDNKTCASCGVGCADCSSSTQCNNCLDPSIMTVVSLTNTCQCNTTGYYVSGRTCTSSCALGTYFSNGACVACGIGCASCASSAACDYCQDMTYMTLSPTSNACTCALGSFVFGGSCISCGPGCSVCNSDTSCTTCADTNMVQDPHSNSCSCKPGYYLQDGTSICSSCGAGCAVCSSSTACATCLDSTMTASSSNNTCSCAGATPFVSGSTCVASCPAGTYPSAGICVTCGTGCSTCSSATTCSTCKSSLMTTSTTGSNTCTCTVPGNFVIGNTCSPCGTGCAVCTSATACTTCNAGYYLTGSTCTACGTGCAACNSATACSTCTDSTMTANKGVNACSCNLGYYLSSDNKTCAACGVGCADCSSSAKCNKCFDPSIMTVVNLSNTCRCNATGYYVSGSTCGLTCETGTYISNGVCVPCGIGCASCASSASCDLCQDTTYMTLSPTSNACTCALGSFVFGGSCISCGPGCSVCNSDTSCTTCADTNMVKDPHSNSCSCKPGYYLQDGTSICSSCGAGCAVCSSSTACATCLDSTMTASSSNNTCSCAGATPFVSGSTCVASCPAGTYPSAGICVTCGTGCYACSDALTCTTCMVTSLMTPVYGSNTCTCIQSYFVTGNTCSRCGSGCVVCKSETVCATCDAGYYLTATTCTACGTGCALCKSATTCSTCTDPNMTANSGVNTCGCNLGYYLSSDNKTCASCGVGCAECSSSTQCTRCFDPAIMTVVNLTNTCMCSTPGLYVSGSTCNSTCGTGTYFSNSNCVACGAGCAACSSSSECTACQDTTHMTKISLQNSCACPAHQYISNGSCALCGNGCSECPSKNECTTCIAVSHVVKNTGFNTCSCSVGYYFDGTACLACGYGCADCGSSTLCLTCIVPAKMSRVDGTNTCKCTSGVVDSGVCVDSCPVGKYNSGGQCMPCGTGCSDCPSATACFTCTYAALMFPTYELNTCTCNAGYYLNVSSCMACGSRCAVCTSSTVCSTCTDITSMIPDTGANTCKCKPGYYLASATTCATCGIGCAVCSSSTACTTCLDASIMDVILNLNACQCKDTSKFVSGSTCISTCVSGTYSSGQTCVPCGIGCATCTSSTTCTTCQDQTHMTKGPGNTCICDPGQYVSGSFCQYCGAGCADCNSPTSCTTCSDTTNMTKTSGANGCDCKPGYYLRAGNTVCSACGPSCATCDSATACLTCTDITNMTVNSGTACSCNSGFYLPSGTTFCLPCLSGCSQCPNSTACTICVDTNKDPVSKCANCKAHFYPSGLTCTACVTGCDTCTSTGCTACLVTTRVPTSNCTTCQAHYYPSGTTCTACATGCDTCTSAGCTVCTDLKKDPTSGCTTCISGYHFPSGSPLCCPTPCSACSVACSACTDPNMSPLSNCTTCKAGYYNNGTACVACGKFCSVCTSGTSCNTCTDQNSMLPSTSATTCSCNPGWYDNGTGCTICGTYCATCNNTNCITCKDPASQMTLGTTCICKPQYIDNGSGCTPCDASCTACNSATTMCKDACASSYFPAVALPGVCTKKCDSSCATCSTSALICDTCSVGYFPVQTLPSPCTNICDASCLSCQDLPTTCTTCSNGYIPVTTLPGKCTSRCHSSCATCSQSMAICDTCSPSYFPKQALPGVCVQTCDVTCATCSGSAVNCLTCSNEYKQYSTLPGKCVALDVCSSSCLNCGTYSAVDCASCTTGFVFNPATALCLYANCHSSCSTCLGPNYTDCVKCDASHSYQTLSSVCKYTGTCPGACATCFNPSADACLSCKPNALMAAGTTQCDCKTFYSLDAATSSCVYIGPCDATCATCSGATVTQCLTCPAHSALQTNNSCLCNASYPLTNNVCTYSGICDATCNTCSGPSSIECITCQSNATLQGTSCSCNQNYVWNVSTCKYTGTCDATCATCFGPAATQCSTCTDTAKSLLSANTCTCHANYTWSSSALLCVYSGPCAEAYTACSGPLASQGTTCDPNAIRDNTNACVCRPFFSWSTSSHRCILTGTCNSICLTCSGTGSTECLSCDSSLYLALTTTNTCACIPGFYMTTSGCQACDITCSSCTAPSAAKCLSCYTNASLTSSGTCACSPGFYPNTNAKNCSACLPVCYTCSDAVSCMSCAGGYVMQTGGICQCPAGTYFDSNSCKACSPLCGTCSGPLATECTSCNSGTLTSGSCVCPSGQYNANGTCTACYVGCKTCNGSGSSACQSCFSPSFLFSTSGPSQCVCPSPLKPAPTPNSCAACPTVCADCNISDSNQCTACRTNAVPKQGSFPSACVCKAGYYMDSTTYQCLPCHYSCTTCTSGSPLFCTSCNGVFSLGGLYCQDYCPLSFQKAQGACVATSTSQSIFDQLFNSLISPYKDTVNSYLSVPGPTTALPTVIYNQGINFSSLQFVQLPSSSTDTRDLILPGSFIAELWIRPNIVTGTSCLLSKIINTTQLISLCIVNGAMQFTIKLYQVSTIAIAPTAYLYASGLAADTTISGGVLTAPSTSSTSWYQIRASVDSQILIASRAVVLTLSINGSVVSTVTVPNAFFRDFNSGDGAIQFLLGAQKSAPLTSGYAGEVAELLISVGTKTQVPCTCTTCSTSGMCLTSCLSNQFLLSTACQTCPSSCSTGCLRAFDCVLNVDPQCASSTDFNVCTACKPLSKLTSNTCACISNASFDATSGACACNSGYQVAGGICVSCLSYFKAGDVSAQMSASYMQLLLTFASSVDTANLRSCSSIFDAATVAKFGTAPNCVFSDLTHLSVTFGIGATLTNEQIVLNIPDVHSAVGTCSFTAVALTPTVTYAVQPPTPVAVITAPGSYSMSCSTASSLQFSGLSSSGGAGRPLLYKWTITSGTQTVASQYAIYSSDNGKISLTNDQLPIGSLAVLLSVKNFFGNSGSASLSLNVTSTDQLSLSVDGGAAISMKTSQSRRLKVNMGPTCNSAAASYDYVWSFVKATPSLPTTVSIPTILSGAQKNSLKIPANSLRSGAVYEFQCVVTGGGLTGSALADITVVTSPLKVICDHSDGPQSVKQDLVVDCTGSIDPDSPSDPVTAAWTCVQNSAACKTAAGAALTFTSNSLTLNIPANTFAADQDYIFTLTISKDTRTASSAIDFTTFGTSDVQVVNTFSNVVITNQRPTTAAPKISGAGDAVVTWTQLPGTDSVTSLTPLNYPYLTFPAAADSTQGVSYQFLMSLVLPTGQAISLKVKFTVAYSPQGGSLSVSPASGPATTIFTLTSSGWVDPANLYYPLTQAFGYLKGANEILFSVPQLGSTFSTVLAPGSYNLVVKVCNSISACTSTYAYVSVTLKRQLQSSNFIALFDQLTVDQDMIASTCANILQIYSVNQTAWDYVLGKANSYISSFSSLSDMQLLAVLPCLQALGTSLQTFNNLNTVKSAVSQALGLYHDGLYSTPVNQLMGLFQTYNATSLADWLSLSSYYQSIEQAFLNIFLPDQTAFKYGGSIAGSFIQKISASNLNKLFTASAGNFSVAIPSTFLNETGIQSSQILNLVINQFNNSLFPAGIVSVIVQSAGTYANLNYLSADPVNITITNLTTPINVTVPLFNFTSATPTCMYLSDAGTWQTGGCSIVSYAKKTMTLSILRSGVFTVVPTTQQFVTPSPLPTFPVTLDTTCDRYYGPIFILISFTGLTLILIAIGRVIGIRSELKKSKRVKINPEQPQNPSLPEVQALAPQEQPNRRGSEILNVSHALPSQDQARPDQLGLVAEEHGSNPNTEVVRQSLSPDQGAAGHHGANQLSAIPEGAEAANLLVSDRPLISVQQEERNNPISAIQESQVPAIHKEEDEQEEKPTPAFLQFLSGHYFLSLFLHRIQWRDLACFLTVMLSHLFFLGVFYFYIMDSRTAGQEVSDATFFQNYEGEDVKYYVWAFLISTVISIVITTLRFAGEVKTGEVKKVLTVALIVVCAGLSILFIILTVLMNIAVCYEYAGRWSVGFLWCALTEVILLELFVAGYRFVLLKIKGKNHSSNYRAS